MIPRGTSFLDSSLCLIVVEIWDGNSGCITVLLGNLSDFEGLLKLKASRKPLGTILP